MKHHMQILFQFHWDPGESAKIIVGKQFELIYYFSKNFAFSEDCIPEKKLVSLNLMLECSK